MADKEELIESFCNITGVEKPRAKLYLESAGWNLDLSISSFYEESDELDQQQNATLPIEEDNNSEPEEIDLSKKIQNVQSESASAVKASTNRIATISSFAAEDNSSDEEGQRFYAGGSERSGQQVLGPKKKSSGKDIVSEMFKAAKEHGAEVLDPSAAQSTSKSRSGPSVFRGAGFKLGSSENDSHMVGVAGQAPKTPSPIEMVLRLWKNGFSVDNGPIRDYQDPTNKEFLDSITRGEIPRELVQQSKGAEVSLNMEDHRNEEFKAPKQKVKVFAGEGHRLGSPSPNLVGQTQTVKNGNPKENETRAQGVLNLKEDEAQTNIQIRLADGSRVIARLNHTHRVSDINRFIINARPQFMGTAFALMTTFPNRELSDDSLTVKEADLLNAVIVQRLK